MQGKADTLTVLLQLQGLDSYLECMLILFQHADSIMDVLFSAQEKVLIVFSHHRAIVRRENEPAGISANRSTL